MEVRPIYFVNALEETMSGKIRVMVPELMRARGIRPMDLIYGARIAPGTAYTLSDDEKSQKMTGITFDVLAKLCAFFGVGAGEIIRFEEETGNE